MALLAAILAACEPPRAKSAAESAATHQEKERPAAQTGSGATPAVRYAVGFRSERLFREHFAKHGREFGRIDAREYLRLAQALRDARPGDDVLEIVRADSVISRFDRSTGSFVAFNRDLTIRTFFRPNDGEAYFRRQARRRPGQ